MNIAMISLYLPSGSKIGVGYQAHYMANALTKRGHRVTMFSPCNPTDGALYETTVVDPGLSMRTFGFARRLRSMDWSGFDVIHAHGDDYWLGRMKPVHIRTMHGSCIAEARVIPGLREKARMALLGLSEIFATRVADRTVCVSENTRRFFPWLKDVIVNGVDTSVFTPGGLEDISAEPTILFVGTFHNRKRGKLLWEAFRDVIRPALPNARLQMVCESAPESPGVEIYSRIPTDQLAELYRKAWAFCLPSTYEGFGVPYIEAMASGTPVVATPNVGAVEVLGNGQFGVLCDADRLGHTLLALLNDPGERLRLSKAGLDRATHYSWDRVIDQYEEIYRTARPDGGSVRVSESQVTS